jgi:hypothetical protein
MALAGCSKGQVVGQGQGCKDSKGRPVKCSVLSSKSPNAKPTTSKKPSVKPTIKKTVAPPSYKGRTFKVLIHDQYHQYEIYDPKGAALGSQAIVYVGDIIVFQNLDKNTPTGHSFTEDKKAWDSGILKYKGQWKWTVDVPAAPKGTDYKFHDENIQYIRGGPLRVLPAPTS